MPRDSRQRRPVNFRIARNPGPIQLPRYRKVQPFDNLCPRLPEIAWGHTKSSAHWAPAVWAKCIKPALARVGDDPGGRPNHDQGRGPGRRSADDRASAQPIKILLHEIAA